MKLSVVQAARNEEENIARNIKSFKNIADEIIVVDDGSSDKTAEIAKKLGAKVFPFKHKSNFHEAKQFAINKATGDWILQMDTDEVVTQALADEIKSVMEGKHDLFIKQNVTTKKFFKKQMLFKRHEDLIKEREGELGTTTGDIVAYFIPRVNIFMGKPLIYGGVYPDGVIRLFKKGKAHLPGESVHELMKVDGKVDWLFSDIEHYDSPTLDRYLERNKRYVNLLAEDLRREKVGKNFVTAFKFLLIFPISNFLLLFFRHKAILDGWRGLLWSFFSAFRFPRAYLKFLQINKRNNT